jgi:5-methylcytosine-specific restriction endonuclease McrA
VTKKEKQREASRRFRENHPEREREHHRAWYKKNAERILKKNNEYNKAHRKLGPRKPPANQYTKLGGVKLTHCKRGHEFTSENTAIRPNGSRRCRQCKRIYDKLRPDLRVAVIARYRTRKTNAGGCFTAEEFATLCRKQDYLCLCCMKSAPLTADHITPVFKGGTSNIENIQGLCQVCNSRKGTRLIDYRPGFPLEIV